MKKRSLFNLMFGNKQIQPNTMEKFKLVNTTNGTFYSWNGSLYNTDVIRSVIRPKAKAVSKLTPKHISGSSEDIKINNNPAIKRLLKKPNEFMSMQNLLEKMEWQLELTNNAFAYARRDKFTGLIDAIYPLVSSSVDLYYVSKEIYCKFSFMGGSKITVPYTDIVHLRKDFIDNDFFGNSGIQSLDGSMQVITSTDQSVVNAIKSSAVIKWLLKFNTVLRPEDKDKEVAKFAKSYLEANEAGVAATDGKFDAQQVEQKNYVPNAKIMDRSILRIYSYFGVNDSIVRNDFTEFQWQAFYEQEIEPTAHQLSDKFTNLFFNDKQQSYGNKIIFDANNLQYASMATKMALTDFVDRGMMTPNAALKIFNLPSVEGGDKLIRRLDTAVVEVEEIDDNKKVEKGEDDES